MATHSEHLKIPQEELEHIRQTGGTKGSSFEKPLKVLSRIGFIALVLLIVFYTLFPFYWAIVSSLSPYSELVSNQIRLWPEELTWENYQRVFEDERFVRGLMNSAIISTAVVILSLVFGTLTAYAMARLHFRGRTFFMYLILSMTMFPGIAIIGSLFQMMRVVNAFHLIAALLVLLLGFLLIMVRTRIEGSRGLLVMGLTALGFVAVIAIIHWLFPALYETMRNAHPYDRMWGLIVVYLSFALPFTVWVLANFFRAMPADLEQAALVDGATQMMALRQVLLPLAIPGMVTTGLLAFIEAWSEFLYARTFTISNKSKTVQVVISEFTGNTQFEQPFGVKMAAAVIVTVPLIIGVLLVQKRIISGMTAGAVKG